MAKTTTYKANSNPYASVFMYSKLPYTNPKTLVKFYPGVNAMLRDLQTNYMTPKKSGSNSSSTMGMNFPETLDTFLNNPSSVRQFDESDIKLTQEQEPGIVIEHDVTGDMLDMGKYMAGEPEHYMYTLEGMPRGRRVRIVYNLDGTAGMNAETCLASQKRLLRLIDWLESQNVRVAITTITSDKLVHIECQVKDYHEPLNLNDIAVTTHPAMFGRLVWRLIEHGKNAGFGDCSEFLYFALANPELFKSPDPNEITIYAGIHYWNYEQDFDRLEAKLTEVLPKPNAEVLTVLT